MDSRALYTSLAYLCYDSAPQGEPGMAAQRTQAPQPDNPHSYHIAEPNGRWS